MPRCKRCGRPFRPIREGQEFGPKCARILAGQTQLDSQNLVSGVMMRKKKVEIVPIYIKDEKGEVAAVIL